MSVHEAQPGDIYADGNGELWRVVRALIYVFDLAENVV